MRFVVTFNDSGTEGVMIFSASDMEDAFRFIRDPKNFYNPDNVSNPVPFTGGIDELYKMFPLKRKTVEES